ncbi:hypothetical protein PBAT_23810 [Paenibacillus antarcticus]|uniref:Uncharacterized protein n=2 Tax=Paenibacillus antarcticus TaxID=253703 RepID=A0A162M938_9BACL|nr:DUF5693 family protein [Paenibacillus antarcticus]OAB40333.1 hypothetical protein PBAT_23810 [Paenibacillus antarcticus]
MLNGYRQINRKMLRWLWCLVILGIIASIPVVYHRMNTESTSNNVEFVFNYKNLLQISDYKPNPRQFVEEQLTLMQQAGITSMAVNESTLNTLKLSRRIELFSSHEATALTQTQISPDQNFTYILFAEKDSELEMKTMIEQNFTRLNIKFHPWTYKQQNGLIIEMPLADASLVPMDPDPVTMTLLKDKGFHIVAMLSNHRQPFSLDYMEDVLKELDQFDIQSVIIDGATVPGYSNDGEPNDINSMAGLFNKHNVAVAFIEMQKADPLGFDTLANQLHYNIFRLHKFSEKDASKLLENVTLEELDQQIQRYADRFVLAVKDRNIRMILLNSIPAQSEESGMYSDPLKHIYSILDGTDGAVTRIQDAGFTIGSAHSFSLTDINMNTMLTILIVLGSVSLITIMMSAFVPSHALSILILGLLGTGGIGILSSNLLYKMLALGVAISAPSIALFITMTWLRNKQITKTSTTPWFAFILFLYTSLISLIGGIYIVSLLDNVTYLLYIDQFIGVRMASLVPIVLVGLYLLFFNEGLTFEGKIAKAKRLLLTHISVLWVIGAGFTLVVMLYYISRTGNGGSATSIELFFRSLLENTIGIRPRNKEFLFSHPLFILGAYLALRRRPGALYILALGIIGQTSLVDTFAHLHTPFHISLIRATYGVIFGAVVSLLYLGVWNVLEIIWNKFVTSSGRKPSIKVKDNITM